MADPFDTLGVEPRFDLDPGAIRRAYLSRVAATHPDTDAAADGRASAALNDAKRVLEDPERRANALLARMGGPSKEQDKSLPAGFLADVIELRESVEIALASKEGDARTRVEDEAQTRRSDHIRRITELFLAAGPSPSGATLAAIRVELNAWRYVERLIEQLDPAYDPNRADFAP